MRRRHLSEYKEQLDEKWFNLIAQGKKIVECRKRTTKRFADIQVGDIFDFVSSVNPKLHCYCKITEINCYKGPNALDRLLTNEKLENVLPGVETIQEGITIYKTHPMNWTDEEIEQGVLAIRLEKIGVDIEDD
jgi:ASC-1-like (ASCH) protein